MRRVLTAATLALAGCAVLDNVTPIGDGAFMAVVQSNDVNAPVANESAKALSQAQAFCAQRRARVEVIKMDAPSPSPGHAPSAEIDFRCAKDS